MKKAIMVLVFATIGMIANSCNSCNSNRNLQSKDNSIANCEKSQLYEFFIYHVEHSHRILGEKAYYYAYFFETDTNYVSIWRSPLELHLNDLSKENPDFFFEFRYLKVADINFIIITDQYFDSDELLLPCEECFLSIADLPEAENMFYDGPLFPKTYKYDIVKDRYIFKKQDKYNIDFLGNEMVKWEEYAIKKHKEQYPNGNF